MSQISTPAPIKILTESTADSQVRLRAHNLDVANCAECATGRPFNAHLGSNRCRSNSLANGGTTAHCTCSSCY